MLLFAWLQMAYYCCKQHQTHHWRQHKKVCGHLKQLAAEAAQRPPTAAAAAAAATAAAAGGAAEAATGATGPQPARQLMHMVQLQSF
jgi:hypothetical protein